MRVGVTFAATAVAILIARIEGLVFGLDARPPPIPTVSAVVVATVLPLWFAPHPITVVPWLRGAALATGIGVVLCIR